MSKKTIAEHQSAFLSLVNTAISDQVKAIKEYQGELSPERLKARAIQTPTVFYLFSGSYGAGNKGERRFEIFRGTFIFCVSSLRAADSAGATGVSSSASALLDATNAALEGKALFAGSFPIDLIRQQLLLISGAMAVYAAEYSVKQSYLVPFT